MRQRQIVDVALKTLRDAIEKGDSTYGKEEQIKSAMSTLKLYPEILAEKSMGYLKPFVEKDYETAFTTTKLTDKGQTDVKIGSLIKAIAASITPEMTEELIRTGSFTPLAQSPIFAASSMSVAINRMCTTKTDEEDRSIQGAKKFFENQEKDSNKSQKYTSYLQSNYLLLVAVLATKGLLKDEAVMI